MPIVVEEKKIGTIEVKRRIEVKPLIKERIAKAWGVIKDIYIFYEIVEKIREIFLARHQNEG